eukprot:1382487-Pleurochrysis_carterae.AAC.1
MPDAKHARCRQARVVLPISPPFRRPTLRARRQPAAHRILRFRLGDASLDFRPRIHVRTSRHHMEQQEAAFCGTLVL